MTHQMKWSVLMVAALFTGLAVTGAHAARVTIDDFETPPGGQEAIDNNPEVDVRAVSQVQADTALGNWRDLIANETRDQDDDGEAASNVNQEVPGAWVSHADDARARFGTEWDGQDDPAEGIDVNGLGEVDLTDGGQNNAFRVTVLRNNSEFEDPRFLRLSVWSEDPEDGAIRATAKAQLPEVGEQDAPEFLHIPFSSFSNLDEIDFSAVGAVRARLRRENLNQALRQNTEIWIGDISAIPTPAALPAGLALMGVAALRRRRRSA